MFGFQGEREKKKENLKKEEESGVSKSNCNPR